MVTPERLNELIETAEIVPSFDDNGDIRLFTKEQLSDVILKGESLREILKLAKGALILRAASKEFSKGVKNVLEREHFETHVALFKYDLNSHFKFFNVALEEFKKEVGDE